MIVGLGFDPPMRGSIDQHGSFRVGKQQDVPGGDVMRMQIDGRFIDYSRYEYVRRTSVFSRGRLRNTSRDVGHGRRTRC